MAHVKAQGTQVFAVVDGAVVRFTCPKAFSFGEDSFSKIDSTCLDSDTYRDWETDRKSTRLNSSHSAKSRMPSSA